MSITGDKPGTTNYTAMCDDGSTVSLTVPLSVADGAEFYAFARWAGYPARQATIEVTMDADVTATVVYAEAALRGTMYLEGPDDRGEGPLPPATGMSNMDELGLFFVDLYAEDMHGFLGFQLALDFLDNTLTSAAGSTVFMAYNHFVPDESAPWGDRQITWNQEFLPEIMEAVAGDTFGLISTEREWLPDPINDWGDVVDKTISEKTWLMTVGYWYIPGVEGTYTIGPNPETTEFGTADATPIPYAVITGSVTIDSLEPASRLDHFEWSTISSPQNVDEPFAVTLTAKDASGGTVTDFTGSVQLSAARGEGLGTVEMLTFVKYADMDEEYPRTLSAISDHFTDYNETTTTTTDPTALEAELAGKHVFLIVDQDNGGTLHAMILLGKSWATVLNNFVSSGGIVIACSYYDVYFIFARSGLMTLERVSGSVSMQATKPIEHLLTDGVSVPFTARLVGYYSTTNGTVALETTGGDALVIVRDIGAGHAVLIGTDYYDPGTGMDRIIANAVKWGQPPAYVPVLLTPATTGDFVNGSWTGNVTVLEAANDVFLQADDGSGHTGESNTFNVLQPHTLAVQSTPIIGVSITGDKPGTTNYAVTCNDQEIVNLTAAPSVTDESVPYSFIRWENHPNGQATIVLAMNGSRTATAVYAATGMMYIEGPDDRGEGPLPPATGMNSLNELGLFFVDIYAESMPGFMGFQTTLEFLDDTVTNAAGSTIFIAYTTQCIIYATLSA